MATITTSQYLDNGTARTAGEIWTINNNATLTVRTDSRVHANAPSLMTGTFGNITVNEGEFFIDATNVRWLKFNSASGTVPAIGTNITQGVVSAYLLGVWPDLVSAPLATGATMPASGYLKFREVIGGTFAPGVLSGISASAVAGDVTGWLEQVALQTATINVLRLGKFKTRGSYFYLDDTTGIRGQVLQTPTNGGGNNTYCAGVEIETSPGSGVYDRYPALNGATNGWSVSNLGQAQGASDKRQQYVKMLSNGRMQLGESTTMSGTWEHVAAQSSTYASNTNAGTYVRKNNVVTVVCSAGHFLKDGQQVGVAIQTGTATSAIVSANVLDPFYFTFEQTGADTIGTCNCRSSVAVTFTAHTLLEGESVYLTPSTGTLPAGLYEAYAIPSANVYWIKYPHINVLTSGNAAAIHSITVTITTPASHGLNVGNNVYCDFTSGTATDGTYVIRSITTNTYRINHPSSAVSSGNITTYHDIGYVPPAGCKTRIPNIITRECSASTHAVNNAPNATLATRPEFATTSAGLIDLEYLYNCNWYENYNQPYSIRKRNCFFMDQVVASECATTIDIDGDCSGMYAALPTASYSFTINQVGTSVKNAVLVRGSTPTTSGHNFVISYSNNVYLENVKAAIVNYARSSGYPISLTLCNNVTINNCNTLNNVLWATVCNNIKVNNLDYCDRLIGYTNSTTASHCLTLDACNTAEVNGMTFGFNWSYANCHPNSTVVRLSSVVTNVKIRDIGTETTPIPCGTWGVNAYGLAYLVSTANVSSYIKVQNCFVDRARVSPLLLTNSDFGYTVENVLLKNLYNGSYAVNVTPLNVNNSEFKGVGMWNETAGNASVYGQIWRVMHAKGISRIGLFMNEPTELTSSQFKKISGRAEFNSSGGVLMTSAGSQAEWETPYLIKGISAFDTLVAPVMIGGGTLSNWTVEYAIDTGYGYGDWYNVSLPVTLTGGVSGQNTVTIAGVTGGTLRVGDYLFGGTNMSTDNYITAINGNTVTMSRANTGTVSGTAYACQLPNNAVPASGFKMKMRVTARVDNAAAIVSIRLNAISTVSDQLSNTYPLDTNTLTVTGLVPYSDVVILQAGTSVVLGAVDSNPSSSWKYIYETPQSVDIGIIKPGYVPLYIRNYVLTDSDSSIPVSQQHDRNYI